MIPWYLIALVTPVLYSFTNFIDKYLIDQKIKEPMTITTIVSFMLGIFGILIAIFNGFTYIGLTQIGILMLAGFLLTFYLIPYFEAMKIEDASRIVPLFQFIPVFTLILSTFILKETLNPKQIVGLVLVVCAGIAVSAEKIDGGFFRPRKALWYMLLASFMYGLIGILFRYVSMDVDFWTVLSYEYIGCGIAGLLLYATPKVRRGIQHDMKVIKSSSGLMSVNVILTILPQMAESYAVTLVAVPFVSLIGTVQPVFSLVEGIILTKKFPHIIKENISKEVVVTKLLASAVIFGGLYLVYF